MENSPRVSVIILNWNQPEFTLKCVKSVLGQDYKDFEILLVDNDSKDDSVDIFRREFTSNKRIRVLVNSDNLGYAGGNNEGVRLAKGEYIAILNNDTTVKKDWLGELVKAIESDEKIGAVSAWEMRGDSITPEDEEKSVAEFMDRGITTSLLGYHARYKRKHPTKENVVQEFGIDGCSFIYRKNLIELPFDPDYFIYAEETHLAWLLNLKGYRTAFSTKAIVHHHHNLMKKTDTEFSKRALYLGERNRVMNLLTFYEKKNLLKIAPLLALNIILLSLFEPRKFPYRLKGYLWIMGDSGKVLKKRSIAQKQRKVPDETIIRTMSCILREPRSSKALAIVNIFFHLYSSIVGLRTIERS